MGGFSDWLSDLSDRIQEFFSLKKEDGRSEDGENVSENRLYVGNLNYSVKEEDLKNLFSKYGSPKGVHLIRDRFTRKLKGYAFVEIGAAEAEKALELNGTEFLGRKIIVSRAKVKASKGRRPRGKFNRSRPRRGGGNASGGGAGRPFYKKEDLPPVKRLE